jgi:hypothetical protein
VNDVGTHLLLFALIGVGIMAMASFYSEAQDRPALRSLPRRFVVFVIGCGILAALMVLAEHTVASVH